MRTFGSESFYFVKGIMQAPVDEKFHRSLLSKTTTEKFELKFPSTWLGYCKKWSSNFSSLINAFNWFMLNSSKCFVWDIWETLPQTFGICASSCGCIYENQSRSNLYLTRCPEFTGSSVYCRLQSIHIWSTFQWTCRYYLSHKEISIRYI